jgi:hypothetical protein
MSLPNWFLTEAGGSVVSYDFYDLMTGTGYKTFYGLSLYEASTQDYALVSDAMACREEYPDGAYTNSGSNTAMDLDFDMLVAVPCTLQGNAIVNVPIAMYNSAGGATITTAMTAILYKVAVGGAETQLGSTVSDSITVVTSGLGIRSWGMFTGRIVVPITQLAVGESIRLSITTGAAGANNFVLMYHDPTRLDVTSVLLDTQLKINLPFKVAQ